MQLPESMVNVMGPIPIVRVAKELIQTRQHVAANRVRVGTIHIERLQYQIVNRFWRIRLQEPMLASQVNHAVASPTDWQCIKKAFYRLIAGIQQDSIVFQDQYTSHSIIQALFDDV